MKTLMAIYIERYAKEHKLSKAALAHELGYANASTLANKLSGARAFSVDELHTMAQALDTSMDNLYFLITH